MPDCAISRRFIVCGSPIQMKRWLPFRKYRWKLPATRGSMRAGLRRAAAVDARRIHRPYHPVAQRPLQREECRDIRRPREIDQPRRRAVMLHQRQPLEIVIHCRRLVQELVRLALEDPQDARLLLLPRLAAPRGNSAGSARASCRAASARRAPREMPSSNTEGFVMCSRNASQVSTRNTRYGRRARLRCAIRLLW